MPFSNSQEQGKPVAIKDEGITITPSVSSIDFAGAGVTGGVLGTAITETIPGGAGVNFIINEVVAGSTNTFTLAHTPTLGTEAVHALGQRLTPTTDYTIAGAIITTTGTWNSGEILVDYQY